MGTEGNERADAQKGRWASHRQGTDAPNLAGEVPLAAPVTNAAAWREDVTGSSQANVPHTNHKANRPQITEPMLEAPRVARTAEANGDKDANKLRNLAKCTTAEQPVSMRTHIYIYVHMYMCLHMFAYRLSNVCLSGCMYLCM